MHRRKRRLIGQVVSEKSMRSFEPTMLQEIDVFLKKLMKASNSSARVNITPAVRQLGVDIVGHLGFGFDLNMQTEETNHWLLKAFYLGDWRVNVCMQWPLLTWIRPEVISNLMPNSIRSRLFNLVDTMIKARLSQKIDSKHDLLGVIAGSMGDDFKSLRQQELWTEAFFFFPAGMWIFISLDDMIY
jgi:cytochrome P450